MQKLTSQGCSLAPLLMIYRDPPEVILNRADVVTLFDPEKPEWNRVVVTIEGPHRLCSRDFMVVDIPVDSANSTAVDEWLERIEKARI